jgi:large subunit ribosomal protein L9
MEVILTEDIPKLGHAGDLVRVKDGYARNYLLPRGMALLATRGRVRELEHQKRMVEEKNRKELHGHEAVARQLNEAELEFGVHASGEGKLFGSVTNADIAEQLHAKGIEVERRKIDLPEPIKQVGEYSVPVRLHRQVTAEVAVRVVSVDTPPGDEAPEAGAEEAAEASAEESDEETAGPLE